MSIFAKEAPIYNKLSESKTQCGICPRSCLLSSGERSFCGLYININGKLFIEEYGAVIACFPTNYGQIFFHPEQYLLTVKLPGCHVGCDFCQDGIVYTGHKIENVKPYLKTTPFAVATTLDHQKLIMPKSFRRVSPQQIIEIMQNSCNYFGAECHGLNFTLEPSINLSWVSEAAQLCHETGGVNFLNTCGFLSQQTTELLSKHIDSVKLSFKSNGNKKFYRAHADVDSKHVFNCAKTFKENGVFLQIINSFEVGTPLDEFREWTRWIVENLGVDTPIAIHPIDLLYQESNEYCVCLEQIAIEEGIRFFNIAKPLRPGDICSWKCPECKNPISNTIMTPVYSLNLGMELFDTSESATPISMVSMTLNGDSQGKCLNCGCQTPIKP